MHNVDLYTQSRILCCVEFCVHCRILYTVNLQIQMSSLFLKPLRKNNVYVFFTYLNDILFSTDVIYLYLCSHENHQNNELRILRENICVAYDNFTFIYFVNVCVSHLMLFTL